MARILTPTGWKDVLSESHDRLTKREVNQHLKQRGFKPHPNPGRYGYTHTHSRWGSVKVTNMEGGLHIYGKKIDSFSDPEAVRRESLKEEFSFDEMTDEEILDLLEQFSDEELEELAEKTDPVAAVRTVQELIRTNPKHAVAFQSLLTNPNSRVVKKAAARKPQILDPRRWDKWGHKV